MPAPAQNDYLPILVMAGFGVLFAAGALAASWLLGEKGRRIATKDTPYECGMPIVTEAHTRFSVKFYVVAMLFILFDVEIVFMYPWAVAFGSNDRAGTARASSPDLTLLAVEAAAFVLVLFLGWVYAVKKGVLEWQKAD